MVLWRAIVAQTRRITVDGPLPPRIELEPVTAITSITRWTPADDAEVVDAASYNFVSRDPLGPVIVPLDGTNWPAPARAIGSFTLNYSCGFTVTPETAPLADDAVNEVPPSVQLMIKRAISFRSGSGGLAGITIGSLKLDVREVLQLQTRIPREIASIGRSLPVQTGPVRG